MQSQFSYLNMGLGISLPDFAFIQIGFRKLLCLLFLHW